MYIYIYVYIYIYIRESLVKDNKSNLPTPLCWVRLCDHENAMFRNMPQYCSANALCPLEATPSIYCCIMFLISTVHN